VRLIVLNGPPGCGKSTLAQRYVDEHPLSLNLDIDRIRGLIGCWREDPAAAGVLAREIALSAARTHLAAGHDVVIPQFVARLEFLNRIELFAAECSADFHEVVLLPGKAEALRRFAERTRAAADLAHIEAHEMAGGVEGLSAMYDRLLAVVEVRPRAKIVPSAVGEIDRTYEDFIAALG
jgi:predicted kinase